MASRFLCRGVMRWIPPAPAADSTKRSGPLYHRTGLFAAPLARSSARVTWAGRTLASAARGARARSPLTAGRERHFDPDVSAFETDPHATSRRLGERIERR